MPLGGRSLSAARSHGTAGVLRADHVMRAAATAVPRQSATFAHDVRVLGCRKIAQGIARAIGPESTSRDVDARSIGRIPAAPLL